MLYPYMVIVYGYLTIGYTHMPYDPRRAPRASNGAYMWGGIGHAWEGCMHNLYPPMHLGRAMGHDGP